MTVAQATGTGEGLSLPAWPSWTALAVAAVWPIAITLGLDVWSILFPATMVIALILVGANAGHLNKLRSRLAQLRATAARQADREELLDSAMATFEIGLQVQSLLVRVVVMAGFVASLSGLQLLSGVSPVTVGLSGGLVIATVVVVKRMRDVALAADAAYFEIIGRTCDDPPPPMRLFTPIMLGAGAFVALSIVLIVTMAP